MTSTQEPNTTAPQSALCIRSRKWKAKLIVPIYSGTKTSEFCLRIISFSSQESELSFDSKDSKINFDRARSTTVKSLLGRPLCGQAVCTLFFFFYKNLFYKNVEAEIDPNFKNVLRTFLRLRVD